MKLWKASDVEATKQYVLLLMERGDGLRYLRLVEAGNADAVAKGDVDFALMTRTVPHDLASGRDLDGISRRVALTTGDVFHVDAHGSWFTDDEMSDIDGGRADIRWFRGRVPWLAPK